MCRVGRYPPLKRRKRYPTNIGARADFTYSLVHCLPDYSTHRGTIRARNRNPHHQSRNGEVRSRPTDRQTNGHPAKQHQRMVDAFGLSGRGARRSLSRNAKWRFLTNLTLRNIPVRITPKKLLKRRSGRTGNSFRIRSNFGADTGIARAGCTRVAMSLFCDIGAASTISRAGCTFQARQPRA